MKAGHELDALVAKKVMGWVKPRPEWVVSTPDSPWVNPNDGLGYRPDEIPHYSTDIAAAWDVVEKLSEKLDIQISVRDGGVTIEVDAGSIDTFQYISGYPLPLAICIAALGALP